MDGCSRTEMHLSTNIKTNSNIEALSTYVVVLRLLLARKLTAARIDSATLVELVQGLASQSHKLL